VLVRRLAGDLTNRFGRGFGKSNLYQMRGFYQEYPEIFQMSSGKSSRPAKAAILQNASGKSSPLLPWSHYVRLLSVENQHAREFYETEALPGGWTVKQLDRQVNRRSEGEVTPFCPLGRAVSC
jgi:hypothetical protein